MVFKMPVLGHRTGEKDCRLVKTLVLGIKEVQRLVLFYRPPTPAPSSRPGSKADGVQLVDETDHDLE